MADDKTIQEIFHDIKGLIKSVGIVSSDVAVMKTQLNQHLEDHKTRDCQKREDKKNKIGWIIAIVAMILSFLVGCSGLGITLYQLLR